MLKRSVVNRSIELAQAVFAEHGLHLPPFAFWTAADWDAKGPEVDEIRDCMLGWDVTDFGYGQFDVLGRILFTLRNGKGGGRYPKSYAEKFILDPPGQRAPLHYHRRKREDIINRGQSGVIVIELRPAVEPGQPSARPFAVQIDAQTQRFEAAPVQVRLQPGQSICLPPLLLHQFWGAEGGSIAVSGEVSSVCDDVNDNVFIGAATVRFPGIEEDEPRRWYLCHEYPARALERA
jgi:D-lyxose ketol-isomerase